MTELIVIALILGILALGVILIGLGILITAIIIAVTDSVWSFLAFAIGFLLGLALLISAGMKYNR